MTLLHRSRDPHRSALLATGLYLVVAATWIVVSDRMVGLVATAPEQVTTLQTAKGWGFVLVTAAALYLAIRRELSHGRRSEARLEVLAEQSLAGLFVLENGRISDVNQRLLEMLGYEGKKEVLVLSLDRLVHPEDLEGIRDLGAFSRGEPSAGKRFRVRMFRRSGEVMHADVVAGRIELDDASTTIGLVLDSTKQARLEAQVRRTQRMETLGQLTGAIAHDFNNLLTGIIGPLDLCAEALPPDHPSRDDVRLARATAERAATLSRQLLTFSRKRITRRHVFDLNRPIHDVRPLVERLTGEGVEVSFELTDETLPVVMDESQLEQVLVNLVVNAVDAMPDGGELGVRTRRDPGSPETMRHRGGLDPGPHAVLEVRDTGVGISEDARLQIFEPFFTTKAKGTGLGLSTVFGVVDQADGFIRVESEPGRGTTFRVFLPLTDRPLESRDGAASVSSSPAAGGGETVLLVEDEEVVRSVASWILERAGYVVHTAVDAETAIRIWDEGDGSVDLLLTDLVLPGMSGMEIAERLRRREPGLAVLFTSGYSEQELTEEVAEAFESHFLEKPFTMAELEKKVREALAST